MVHGISLVLILSSQKVELSPHSASLPGIPVHFIEAESSMEENSPVEPLARFSEETRGVEENQVKKDVSPAHKRKIKAKQSQNNNSEAVIKHEGGEGAILHPADGNLKPFYPVKARQERIEGTVWLRLTIDHSGRVNQVTSIPPLAHPLLEASAIETVKKWKFVIQGNNLLNNEFIREIPIKFVLE